jgi:hypothetical protein
VIGISRRPPAVGEHVEADLSDPASWPRVAGTFADVVADAEAAVFLHMAGVATPGESVTPADPDAHTAAALWSCASGLALGKAFLDACRTTGTPATLVVCSAPAVPLYGASNHVADEPAHRYWAAAVATEAHSRVLCVLPYVVDRPPVADEQRAAAGPEELATPAANAAQIWSLVLDGLNHDTPVPVGAVPDEPSSTT